MEWSPGEPGRVLGEHAGLDVVTVRSASGGESRSTFWVTERTGTVSVLKILPDAPPETAGRLHALDAALGLLRDRGYPAPRLTATGQVPGLAFWVQQRMPGRVLSDYGSLVARLLPDLLRLNDAQAGLGTGRRASRRQVPPRAWR